MVVAAAVDLGGGEAGLDHPLALGVKAAATVGRERAGHSGRVPLRRRQVR
jgi:hypothetical protein